MKNGILKITVAIILVMLMILPSFSLIGCDKGETVDTESSDVETTVEAISKTTADTESGETETEAPEPGITVFANGKVTCDIVIADKASTVISDAANDLKYAFNNTLNASVIVRKEGTFKLLNGGTLDVAKIVVGALKGDEYCDTLISELENNGDHIITVKNGTLYILGKTDASTAVAVNRFIGFYVNSGVTTISFDAGDVEYIPANYDGITIAGNPIVNYSIVYYSSYYAKACAQQIQTAVEERIGITLPLVPDSHDASECEILVGKTNRSESKAVRSEYYRPNVNYDVVEKNGKLVIMAEGFSTLEEVEKQFINRLKTLDDKHNITGTVISGDVLISDNADNIYEGNMLTRAADTDVRIMVWNMGGPGTYGKPDLAEKLADTILKNLPDVFGTNEFYDPATGEYRVMFDTVMREISEYYYEIESENDFPNDSRLTSFVKSRGPRPQKIFIRKDAGIKVIAAGWRYTEYENDVDYRSFPWAVLETKEGDKFIYTVSHYTNMTNDTAAAIEQLETVAHAQAQSGSSEALPAILSGDLWMARGKGSYKYFTDAGYMNAQREALVNDNNNISHSTFHDYGVLQPTGRAITDFLMYSSGMTPLKFKVITSLEAIDSSDHSPLCADFKFT